MFNRGRRQHPPATNPLPWTHKIHNRGTGLQRLPNENASVLRQSPNLSADYAFNEISNTGSITHDETPFLPQSRRSWSSGFPLAQTPFAPEDIKVPPRDQLLSTFGWVTDIHYSVQPIRRIENEDSIRVYAHSMAKFRQALDLFNTRDLDFMIELGDFKDCQDNGDREGTLNFLKTIENEYRTFNGPRYHTTSIRFLTLTTL